MNKINEKYLKVSDIANPTDEQLKILQKFSGAPKGTRIRIYDADTMELLDTVENKVVITGSMITAAKLFDIPYPVQIPTYNSEMNLENSHPQGTDPLNPPIICLFCVGDSGCGTTETDVYTVKYIDRIKPVDDIMPFRYVDAASDLDSTLRGKYFGRKVLDNGMIAYYFKAFETEPQMFMRYTDSTDITPDIYNVETSQDADCFVDLELLINAVDFRDYFDKVLGWDHARISTISLCHAWYDDTIDEYKWYQDIMPYSKLNFAFEKLVDSTKSILFKYDIFY